MKHAAVLFSGLLSLLCLGPEATARPHLTDDEALERALAGESALQGKALKQAISEAEAFPLGHAKNPVRVSQPAGERSYLAQLRCSDGEAPAYERRGSTGLSPFGNVMDIYLIRCPTGTPQSSDVYMDMYHKGFAETRPVPGFTITP